MSKSDLVRGSQLRCQLLTGLPREEVASRLINLVHPARAVVTAADHWLPCGRCIPFEARLDREPCFVGPGVQESLLRWWLAVRRGANAPNWDIAATCRIEDHPGLILVEAKAHDRELSDAGKDKPTTENGRRNHARIAQAIQEANADLTAILPGWGLSRDRCYQVCNRFAWAWKLATLGVPVALVYLGFLNANEMENRGQPFKTARDWELYLRAHTHGLVPDGAWGQRLRVGSTPLWFLIRALDSQPGA